MIIKKVTNGCVVQEFDTETGKYISQEFYAEGEVNYESPGGNPVDLHVLGQTAKYGPVCFGPYCEVEPYLPFDMVQPS